MRALIGGRWRDDVLDYHRGPAEYRIQVTVWQILERIDGLYFERPRSVRLLLNYLREFGPTQVLRKVMSRSQERGRNEKYVAWGIGVITEAPAQGRHRVGESVAFLATAHPEAVERVVVPEGLLTGVARVPTESDVRCLPPAAPGGDRWWGPATGWSPFSGDPVPTIPLERLGALAASIGETGGTSDRSAPTPVLTTRGAARPSAGRPTAALFGYGNYAKTAALPGVARSLSVQRVHEIDPTQIPIGGGNDPWIWDSSAVMGSERYDAYLIAGFHHTHAPLALSALERGSYAVVEKPIAMDRAQLTALIEATRRAPRLFACFHKRFSPLNAMAVADLGVERGGRIDYHCIVSEVSLPPLHWYRWPNSGSRLVSNGCHWIDHFLHLNDYAAVTSRDLFLAPDGTIQCSAVLENGAVFAMTLTERGSERIGLKDHIELRSHHATVRIQDSRRYVSENSDRVMRRTTSNRFLDHTIMYREIARRIAAGETGDTALSLERSAGLILDLEDRLQELKRSR